MVGGGESMVIGSIASWFTPSVLFCVLNLMIAIIFIASNFKYPHSHPQNLPGQLARSPSLLERFKSVNLSSSYTQHQYPVQSETTSYNSTNHQLSQQAPSLLERVKSVDLSFPYLYGNPQDQSRPYEHEYQSQQTHCDSPGQLVRAPSLLERVKSINLSSMYAQNYNPFPIESEQVDKTPGELARAPSLLDRVKSFKVPSPFSSDHQSGSGDTFSSEDQYTEPDPRHRPAQDHNVTSGRSKKSGENPGKVKKSRSEKRVAASDDGKVDVNLRRIGSKDESVDAKADDFINRFKQQLKLQRLDSLQRLKEMVSR